MIGVTPSRFRVAYERKDGAAELVYTEEFDSVPPHLYQQFETQAAAMNEWANEKMSSQSNARFTMSTSMEPTPSLTMRVTGVTPKEALAGLLGEVLSHFRAEFDTHEQFLARVTLHANLLRTLEIVADNGNLRVVDLASPSEVKEMLDAEVAAVERDPPASPP